MGKNASKNVQALRWRCAQNVELSRSPMCCITLFYSDRMEWIWSGVGVELGLGLSWNWSGVEVELELEWGWVGVGLSSNEVEFGVEWSLEWGGVGIELEREWHGVKEWSWNWVELEWSLELEWSWIVVGVHVEWSWSGVEWSNIISSDCLGTEPGHHQNLFSDRLCREIRNELPWQLILMTCISQPLSRKTLIDVKVHTCR